MRVTGRVLLASAFVLGACAGGEKNQAADTTAMAAPAAAGSSAAGAAGAVAAAPVTGKTDTVKMVMNNESKASFDPQNITVHPGDAITWVVVSGSPHNVVFDSVKAPDAVKAQLAANMPDAIQPLSGKFLMAPGESYTMSFGKIPPGKYYYYCLPHDMIGMNGTVTVQ
ncbi:MAG TPA: plastocyanin/azurin family copper-binding protein [Gemmatimonadaceae bacterium]|nr:plastocyanin/azurin family copper-binding protein [Gemmatimonadaceae bacterium]